MPHARTLALILALAAAGCGEATSTGTKPGGSAAKGTPSAKPAALSEDEYQAVLDDSAHAVSRAIGEVRGAGSTREGLRARLERGAAALDDAAGELGAKPVPRAAAAANENAARALRDLSTAFSSAAGKVETGGLCTGPAALAQVTRSGAAGDLRSAAKSLRTSGLGPKRQPFPALRLKSGSVLSSKGGGSGPGVLIIRNGNSREGVVKLVAGGRRMSIYVARKATARVTGIPDGSFAVYFASGVSWDGKRNTFTRNCGFTKFDPR